MAEQLLLDFGTISPPKRELRELWTPDDIYTALIKDGTSILTEFSEDSRIEWKSAKYPTRDLADYFSMWANTQPYGGLVVIGLEKGGDISGCHAIGSQKIAEFECVGPDHCPDAQYDIRRIPAQRSDGQDDFLLVIRVYYRPEKLVETVRNEAFIRVGNTKHRLTEDEKREIRINKGQIAYEKEPVLLKYPDEFDDLLIQEFCNQYRSKRGLITHHTREQILCLNHFGTMKDGKFQPNLACTLLFGLDPRSAIPGARIRFQRFEGTQEKSGHEYNAVKEAYIDGPIPRLIQETEELVASQIRNFTRLGNDGKFYTRPEYPSEVWLEAIVNACVHRSYNLKNMNIFVKMFDDRFIVESPGAFPPPVTPENIYDTHSPRNPHLMNALFYLDYVKCAHEGTRRMRDFMKSANLPAPEFSRKEIGTHQVHVTLRNNVEARKEFVDAGALKLLGEGVYEQLSGPEKQVINFLAEKGSINVSDANRLLHRDWQTAKRILQGLVHRQILMRRAKTRAIDESW